MAAKTLWDTYQHCEKGLSCDGFDTEQWNWVTADMAKFGIKFGTGCQGIYVRASAGNYTGGWLLPLVQFFISHADLPLRLSLLHQR